MYRQFYGAAVSVRKYADSILGTQNIRVSLLAPNEVT